MSFYRPARFPLNIKQDEGKDAILEQNEEQWEKAEQREAGQQKWSSRVSRSEPTVWIKLLSLFSNCAFH